MAALDSTKRGPKSGKPRTSKKPHPDFPLFRHATGRWCKKVKGKFCYFGKVSDDPDGQAALALWLEQKDDLLAGRVPRPKTGGLTVRDLLNRFLTEKKQAADRGEISSRSFLNYHATCERIGDVFGLTREVADLRSDDFAKLRSRMAETMGLSASKTEIQKTRAVFNYAYGNELIDRPVRYGMAFRAPDEKALRKHKQEQKLQTGVRMFEREEVHALLAACLVNMKAMVLLGVNCGFGNHDVATLPRSAVDLDGGWITYPRPKTGAERRCPLWPETVAALRDVYAKRPEPEHQADNGLVFITRKRGPFVQQAKYGWNDTVNAVFGKVLTRTGLRRKGRSFYGLRRTFETIGGESRDQVAVDYIMGHLRGDMASVYRERISDDRLRAVVEHVRKWLFAAEEVK